MRLALAFISGVAAFGARPPTGTAPCPNICGPAGNAADKQDMVWGKACTAADGSIAGNTQVLLYRAPPRPNRTRAPSRRWLTAQSRRPL